MPLSYWSRKQKRCFQRILSGLKRPSNVANDLRFITLTTAPVEECSSLDSRDLTVFWSILVKRIRRKYKRFEFVKVETSEGNGVIHAIVRCPFISQKWLSDTWRELTSGSYIVDIRMIWQNLKRVSRYLVTQYVSLQSGFLRLGYSQGWIFRGSSSTWKWLCRHFSYRFDMIIPVWDDLLQLPLAVLLNKKKDVLLSELAQVRLDSVGVGVLGSCQNGS